MTELTCLAGASALSGFRRRKLIDVLAPLGGPPPALEARFAYLVESEGPLAADTLESLTALLGAHAGDTVDGEGLLLVVPRLGTVSPWSSKATEIAQRCGLEAVRRVERAVAYTLPPDWLSRAGFEAVAACLHDRMTQAVLREIPAGDRFFAHRPPRPLRRIALGDDGAAVLRRADAELGLALSPDEIDYLVDAYRELGRDPTDAELMMFAQANSEHCRHKIFNASWSVDGEAAERSLFSMIRNTHARAPGGVLSAYHDNAAVIEGAPAARLMTDPDTDAYRYVEETVAIQIKVETHNHPTAISPFPGAATGSGGEIRDEAATGRGAKPKAGLSGFTVSNLRVPGAIEPWEHTMGKPGRIASALDIMIEGPIGAASFNNEFGRPALGGYFRTFEQRVGGREWGYHKPIMIAGGLGNIRPGLVEKQRLEEGDLVIVLGGPAMLIGLGGGAASSMGSGVGDEDLDFASVQRGNPEMQRRCQEVIDRCWARGERNPIRSIHDVGAGGLSNALPELLDDAERGGRLELREVPSADTGMSPMEIWCNEAQERYVLAVAPERIAEFEALCRRERCPFAVLGTATAERTLEVSDRLLGDPPVALPMAVLLGKVPRMHRDARREPVVAQPFDAAALDLHEAARRVLRHPAVGSKSFLVTIGDRTVGGLTARDQMVGPWQVPVADAAVTLHGFRDHAGEAMAMGERTPLAVVNAPASGRMAVGEAITNIASAPVRRLPDVKLSANWMAAAGEPGQDAALFDTVRAVGMELCPALGIAIPVGKDSLSLKTVWGEGEAEHRQLAPVSLVVSAFAPVDDARLALTPQLRGAPGGSRLLLIDLGAGRDRLGGSVLAQVHGGFGAEVPDLDEPARLVALFEGVQRLARAGRLLAYHDRSDGGLLATVAEMAFAGRKGVTLDLGDGLVGRPGALAARLFSEELGAVVEVAEAHVDAVLGALDSGALEGCVSLLGRVDDGDALVVTAGGETAWRASLPELQAEWSRVSRDVARLRDHPDDAQAEWARGGDWSRGGIFPRLGFDPTEDPAAPYVSTGARPPVAILREQGVNGQVEMAAAFDAAGFEAVDVHMSDLASGRRRLDDYRGFVACGGFSYGDVLGAGRGWANSILFDERLREAFAAFLAREDRFALGVCNGCQMLAALREIVPGTATWPDFVRNHSEQFEARLSLVEVGPSPSIFFTGMEGSRLMVATAHGEGRADFGAREAPGALVALRYVEADGTPAVEYPQNPNGSPAGITGLSNGDGRVTVMMPHPERTLRTVNFSWAPDDWRAESPWLRMFRNARWWTQQHA